jgi:hypothetical protein
MKNDRQKQIVKFGMDEILKNISSIKSRLSKIMDLLDCQFLSGKIIVLDHLAKNFV